METMEKYFIRAMIGLEDFKKEQRGAINVVEIVILIGIAVALAVLFRNRISALLNSLFEGIEYNANQAVAPAQ